MENLFQSATNFLVSLGYMGYIFLCPIKRSSNLNLQTELFSKIYSSSILNKTESPLPDFKSDRPVVIVIKKHSLYKPTLKNPPQNSEKFRRLYEIRRGVSGIQQRPSIGRTAPLAVTLKTSVDPQQPNWYFTGDFLLTPTSERDEKKMRLPQLDRKNYRISVEQRLTGVGCEVTNAPISSWIEKSYSAISQLSEAQIKDRDMKLRIVVPFQQFFKKYIGNINDGKKRLTHYGAIREMFQVIKGYTDAEMQEFVTYEEYHETINRKALILPGLDSEQVYQKNTKFISQAFDMFCTVLSDPGTKMLPSNKLDGKFRLTNSYAGFDHQGYGFFRNSNNEGGSPFVFAFAERQHVDSSFKVGSEFESQYPSNGEPTDLIFHLGMKLLNSEINEYIFEEGQLIVLAENVEKWKKNKANEEASTTKDELRRALTKESRLQYQFRGIDGRSEFRYNDSTANDSSTYTYD